MNLMNEAHLPNYITVYTFWIFYTLNIKAQQSRSAIRNKKLFYKRFDRNTTLKNR